MNCLKTSGEVFPPLPEAGNTERQPSLHTPLIMHIVRQIKYYPRQQFTSTDKNTFLDGIFRTKSHFYYYTPTKK